MRNILACFLIFPCSAETAVADGPGEIVALAGHEGLTYCLEFSPDGRSLLTAGPVKGTTNAARLWDVETGHLRATFDGQERGIFGVAFAPDGRSFVSGGADATLRIRDLDGNLLATLPHPEPISRMVLSPDGRSLATSCGLGGAIVRIWDVASRTVIRELKGHADRGTALDFAPDGRTLVSASTDGTVRIWDVATGRNLAVLGDSWGRYLQAKFSPDGSLLAVSIFQNGEIRLYDPSARVVRLTIPLKALYLDFSPDGRSLYLCGDDRRVHVYEIPSGQERAIYPSRLDGRFAEIEASPDGRSVAWCGQGGREGSVLLLRLPAPVGEEGR